MAPNENSFLKEKSHRILMSFSHREFTDSLITQKLTLRQVVDFVYNMDIYDTNMDLYRNYSQHHLLLI